MSDDNNILEIRERNKITSLAQQPFIDFCCRNNVETVEQIQNAMVTAIESTIIALEMLRELRYKWKCGFTPENTFYLIRETEH